MLWNTISNKFITFTLLASIAILPRYGHAATLTDIVVEYTDVLSLLINLGVVAAAAVFIWGVVTFIAKSGDDKEIENGKKRMVWGVVALFVIVSIWGLVALLDQLIGVDGTSSCVGPGIALDGDNPVGVVTCF